jgi:uncharacterized protein YbjT (DUF2867 family)
MILVTGATGNVGAELARALAGGGEEGRALIRRDADRAKLPAGVDAFVGDLSRPETLAGAVDGVSAIHLLGGYEGTERLLPDASRARVERVVLQSSSAVWSGDTSNAVARYRSTDSDHTRARRRGDRSRQRPIYTAVNGSLAGGGGVLRGRGARLRGG